MAPKSTIYEVADRSGVSTATVSRVMRDGHGFSEVTRNRVRSVAAELGWVPSGAARGLAERRVGIIGLLFPDLSEEANVEDESPLFADLVIRGAERAATLAGNAVLIASTRAVSHELVRSVASKVDGLIVTSGSLSNREMTELGRHIPLVVIASRPRSHRFDAVTTDNHGAAKELTRHLLEVHGHRDLAYVAGPARSPDSNQRFTGFHDALADAGLDAPQAPDVHADFTATGGGSAVEAILENRVDPPRAIVFGNDQMAIGGIAALRRHKLRVGVDVAVTGFDDIASARYSRPALTTARQPMRQIGEQAVHTVLTRLAEPERARHIQIIPTAVVIRRSCGCPATSGPQRRQR